MVFLFMMIILPYNPVFDLFGAVVFGSCLFFRVCFFDFSVEVDDNRGNQCNHDNPVYSEYDGYGASQICDRGDITETDRCHQRETVPQRILIVYMNPVMVRRDRIMSSMRDIGWFIPP